MVAPVAVHRFYPLLKVMRELFRGRTLGRAYLHLALSQFKVSGGVLDIGAKHAHSDYWRYIQMGEQTTIIPTDLNPREGVMELNIEKEFPLPNSSVDHVLGLNLLEHVADLSLVAGEISRVVRPNGYTIISTPFLYPYHPDPRDYRRYTDEGLSLLMATDENEVVHVQMLGEGVCTLGVELIVRGVLPSKIAGYIFFLVYPVVGSLDRLLSVRREVAGRTIAQRYPSGVLIALRKRARE